jgi:hypothetical protein
MDTELLVEQKDDGQRLIEQLVRDAFEVKVAFWLKPSEESGWQFYLAAPSVDPSNPDSLGKAYRTVYASLSKLPNPWVGFSDIKLVAGNGQLAMAAAEIRDRGVAPLATVYRGKNLGGTPIEEAYIYPERRTLRLSCTVRYIRENGTNRWKANTRIDDLLTGVKAQGAVGYSTAHYEGESLADVKHAHVMVLVSVDPQFDKSHLDSFPELRRALFRQAATTADVMFKTHHPDAEIEHAEESVEYTSSLPNG